MNLKNLECTERHTGKNRKPNLMMWLMTIGSGGSRRLVRRCGISENFRRGQSKIYERMRPLALIHTKFFGDETKCYTGN